MNKKGTLTLIPTPIDEENNLEPVALELLNKNASTQNSIMVIEDLKPGRRRWLRWGLPRENVESFELYNEHNQQQQCEKLLAELKKGKDVFLMSDGGLPAFCDPGRELVHRCHLNKIKVTATPFYNSISLAVALSGIDHDQFFFRGFLSNKKDLRADQLKDLRKIKHTQVIMDTPYRLKRLLEELSELGLKREHFLALDLGRDSEELYLGTPAKLLSQLKELKREFVLIIGPEYR